MLARALPSILPPLTPRRGGRGDQDPLAGRRPAAGGPGLAAPLPRPSSGISAAGLVGGGTVPRPGEVSLAHAGVLFLDELAEFHRDALEGAAAAARGRVVVTVVAGPRPASQFPARFTLLARDEPLPLRPPRRPAPRLSLPAPAVERYRARVSGPLLDRIDLHVEVPAIRLHDLREPRREGSARARGAGRSARGTPARAASPPTTRRPVNASAHGGGDLSRMSCPLDGRPARCWTPPSSASGSRPGRSHRVLKVARTIADLAGSGAASHRPTSPRRSSTGRWTAACGNEEPNLHGQGRHFWSPRLDTSQP